MEFITKEFTIKLLDGNILAHKVNNDCTEITMEGIVQVVDKIHELIAVNNPPRKMIAHIAPFYVKKQVIKHFTTSLKNSMQFVALICPGYISKYVGSVALKIHQRFNEDDKTVIKVFIEEDKAVEWLSSL